MHENRPEYYKCIVCGADIKSGLFTEMIHYTNCLGKERYDMLVAVADLFRKGFITQEHMERTIKELLDGAATN